jgi:LCP family protein required for cell wall assembly
MAGPGPLDDWSGWNTPTQPMRPRPQGRQLPVSPPHAPIPPLPRRAASPSWHDAPYAEPIAAGTRTGRGDSWRPAPTRLARRPRLPRLVRYGLLAALVLALALGAVAAHRLYTFGQAISAQGPLSTQTGYVSGNQPINLLVLGYGGGGHDGANLTDSMMIVSLVPSTQRTALISVPRDLWVQVPPDSSQYAKINTAYQVGLANGYGGYGPGKLAAGALAARKVSDVTGLPVTYWMTIDFQGFRKLVDTLGGVDVTVLTAFTARYPRNDNPSIDAGWKVVHFNTGPQHMDGERAIEFARARYVEDPPSEGTDFARSARQQILIRAILSRARQVSAWPSLAGATDALQGALYTNLSLADLALLAEKMDFNHARHIGLSTQNVLVNAQSDDGQDILLPANGDWNAVRQYVAAQLGG